MPAPTPIESLPGPAAAEQPGRRWSGRRCPRWLVGLVVVLALGVPTAVQTLPSPRGLAHRVAPNDGDPLFVAWTMQWEAHALVHSPRDTFAGNIFYPRRDAIAWSDNLLAAVPLWLLLTGVTGGRWILAYNLVTLVGFTAVGLATYALACHLLRDRRAAFVAATLVSLSASRSVSVGHTQLVGFCFVPLALLALLRFLEGRRWSDAVLFGLAAAGTWLVTAYYAVLLVLAVGGYLVVWLIAHRIRPGPRVVRGLALAGVVALAVVAPTLPPYLRLQGTFHRSNAEIRAARLVDLRTPPPSAVYRALGVAPAHARYDLGGLYPGALLVALAAVGVVVAAAVWRRRQLHVADVVAATGLGVGALVCLAVAVGPSHRALSMPYGVVRRVVPGASSLRDLNRFWIYPLCCLALLAGLGARELLRRAGRGASALTIALVVLAWGELLYRPPTVPVDMSAAATASNRLLQQLSPGPVAELPEPLGPAFPYVTETRQLRSLIDGDARVDGYSGNVPVETLALEYELSTRPLPELVTVLRAYGVRYVVLHGGPTPCPSAYGPAELTDALAAVGRVDGVLAVRRAAGDAIVELAPAPIDRHISPTGPTIRRGTCSTPNKRFPGGS